MYKLATALLILISLSARAQQPELKGGLMTFVKNNTIYPAYSLHNCIQGIVNIGFKLNDRGEIYYSTITSGVGTDLDDEALRLIRMSSKKWTVPNDHDTTTLLVVPINFSLSGYDCDRKSKGDIALAIKAYKDNEELTKVITNFYQNKEKGNFKPEDEAKIAQIKSQLGIDDEYLDEMVNNGLKKIKQGDRQGACEDFIFVKYMGSDKANDWLTKYCK
ncbi:energy transducer TonB [Pedobacter polaris]|uniref:Energy transducer TonB n=1 Tax=Pedobacter polaris TaxID=2571273 RepID=A0A4U1CUZ6_9SPHI|nr:energy transducer TonB [Pedobacter polaris]TKC12466.1 energy transducer TonB [Pedobacter polaris]